MGIKGLLALTKSVGSSVCISHFKNQSVGIDGFSWVHKAFHLGELSIYTENDIRPIFKYFSKKIKHLLKLNIRVVTVFDGDEMPLKKNTNFKRRE